MKLVCRPIGIRHRGNRVLLEYDPAHPEDLADFKKWLAVLIARCATAEKHPELIKGLLGKRR